MRKRMMKASVLIFLLLGLYGASNSVVEATIFTKPPSPPPTCGLKNGMTQTQCTNLANRWKNGDCQQYNVDNFPNPIVWVGSGCDGFSDGGCKIYNSCLNVHCQKNCAKLGFCQWFASLNTCGYAPTKAPTDAPTPPTVATVSPTLAPDTTQSPTAPTMPTDSPTSLPTKDPTNAPSKVPTKTPTSQPTKVPTNQPTSGSPTTGSPTNNEPTSKSPTSAAPTTRSPTTSSPTSKAPTLQPTKVPTGNPTTNSPTTTSPTQLPTNSPTPQPTSLAPTKQPTKQPTSAPTAPNETRSPTRSPTFRLTNSPTHSPTREPTTLFPTRSPTLTPPTPPTTLSPSFPDTIEPTLSPTTNTPNNGSVILTSSSCDTTCAALATTFTVASSLFLIYGCIACGLCVFSGGAAAATLGGLAGAKKRSAKQDPEAVPVGPPPIDHTHVMVDPAFAGDSSSANGDSMRAPLLSSGNAASAAAAGTGSGSGAAIVGGAALADELEAAKRRTEELASRIEKLNRENVTLEETNKKLEEEVSYLNGLSFENSSML